MRYLLKHKNDFQHVSFVPMENGWSEYRLRGTGKQDESILRLQLKTIGHCRYHLILESNSTPIEVFGICINSHIWLSWSGHSFLVEHMDVMQQKNVQRVDGVERLVSPMPGKVVRVAKRVGDVVMTGDVIVAIEAMKMENVFKASQPGVVETIGVSLGDAISANHVLAEIAPEKA